MNRMTVEEFRAIESEESLLTRVIAEAKEHGWLVQHVRPLKSAKGWRTPIQGDKGGPDLIMARAGRVIFAELKSQKADLEPAQRLWQNAIIGPPPEPGLTMMVSARLCYYVWRPLDWQRIVEVLSSHPSTVGRGE